MREPLFESIADVMGSIRALTEAKERLERRHILRAEDWDN